MTNKQGNSGGKENGCCIILVIDDDAAMRSLLADELGEFGCRVVQAAHGGEALAQLQNATPSLVVTDLNMKDGGFEFIRCLKTTIPHCPIIIVTAFGDAQTRARAKEVGAGGYFDKPVRMADLKSLVKEVCPHPCCQQIRLHWE